MENKEIDYSFRCPRCHQLCIISIFYDKEYKIKVNCFCGNYKETIPYHSLNEYQQQINTLIKNQKCEAISTHSTKEGIYYCMICDKWSCSECKRIHNHKVMKTNKEFSVYCPNHNSAKQLISSYCFQIY